MPVDVIHGVASSARANHFWESESCGKVRRRMESRLRHVRCYQQLSPEDRVIILARRQVDTAGVSCYRGEFVMRLKDKIAVIIGAGQSPGEGMGNGRATVLRFAQEGAKVLAVDNRLASAEETAAMVAQGRVGECVPFEADVTREATLAAAMAEAHRRYGRIDILHYNVGLSIAGGDAPLAEITEEAFDRICAINLRGAVMARSEERRVGKEGRSRRERTDCKRKT